MESDWVKMFDFHDWQLKRALPKSEVAHVIRSCGRLLLPKHMDKLLAPFKDPMSRDDFVAAMKTAVEGEPSEKDLLPALQAFDGKDCGELSRFEVTQIFCHMGEKIPTADVEKLLDGATFIDKDKANINGLHKWLTRPARSVKVTTDELLTLAK